MKIDAELEELTREKLKVEIDKLRSEEEFRSKKNFINLIVVTMTIIVAATAVYTYFIQDRKQIELTNILERQIAFKSDDLRKESERASKRISELIAKIKAQTNALKTIDITKTGDLGQDIPKEIVKLNARFSSLEADLRVIKESQIVNKIKAIEESIEGNPMKVLSVPLIRNDLKNYKLVSEKELLRLEKNLEKLDSRLSFFVTTTITLTLGIFTAVIAPLLISFAKRRRERIANESNT